jgi:hypothetical protein
MMRLVLAPKSMEGIEEKLLKSWSQKIGPEMLLKIKKMENIAAQDRRWFNPKIQIYWCKSRVNKVWKPPRYHPTLWRIGGISHFLSSPLLHHEAHSHLSKSNYSYGVGEGWLNAYLSTNPWVIFIGKLMTKLPLWSNTTKTIKLG